MHSLPGSIITQRMQPKTLGRKLHTIVNIKQTALILPLAFKSRDAVARNIKKNTKKVVIVHSTKMPHSHYHFICSVKSNFQIRKIIS